VPLEISGYDLPWRHPSQIVTLFPAIDSFCKLLKTKTFISQKSLDTPVFRLIRFRQKSFDGILQPPLELFSLEEEAAQLPGGLFVFLSAQTHGRVDFAYERAPDMEP